VELHTKRYAGRGNSRIYDTCFSSVDVLLVASKHVGLETNDEKTKYMVMSQDQHAGQNHNIKIRNKSLERVERL
jgi:hypothetical protein